MARANWTFVAWGALHGVYILFGAATIRLRARVVPAWPLAKIATTNILTGIAWIFFRSASLRDAIYVVSHIFSVGAFQAEDFFRLGLPRFELCLLCAAIATVFAFEYLVDRCPALVGRAFGRRMFRWPAYASALYAFVFFGVFEHVEFIYFHF